MNVLLPLLILAIKPDAPIESRYPGATEVFHCPFDASWDKNFDQWPDEWQRYRGPGFPRYVKIQLSDESTPAGQGCLRIDLDGGAAAVYSPPIPAGPLYAYVLEGLLRTSGLEHDRAHFSLILLNQDLQRLETFRSEQIADSRGWTRLRLGPITPGNDNVRFATVGLHLEPGSQADLSGSACFTDVWLGRLPRISLSLNSRHHIFTNSEGIEVACEVSGFPDKDPPVVFRLEDAFGAEVAQQWRYLKTRVPAADRAVRPDGRARQPSGLAGSAKWQPPVPGPGFYRVGMTMRDRNNVVHRRQLSLAVIDRYPGQTGSEFGWSLPQGDQPLTLTELSQLVSQAGIGWVKYPLWHDQETAQQQVEELVHFTERLAAQGIELVGLLHGPPEALRSQFPDLRSPAEIFTADPNCWYPSLEWILARMAMHVRWWQLGHDRDTGFVDYPKLAEKTAQVKSQFDKLCHDVNLGFGWEWMHELPQPGPEKAPWRFLTLSAHPPLTHQELSVYLSSSSSAPWQRWVVLEPLSQERYPLSARVNDLVRRMMAAKIHGAEAVFIPDPFSTECGLMNDDGTVGELLLPWRTCALMLGGAKYLGSIQLPGGSPNHIFARAHDAVMVVWNDTPRQEVICLGRDVRQVDLWGRTTVPSSQGHRQVIEVGPLPTFVTGVDQKITRWRQEFSFAAHRLPSVAGGEHGNRFRLKNSFGEGISGNLELIGPDFWKLDPQRVEFRLARDEQLEQPLRIALPYNATSGRHTLRVDFEVDADQTYRFSVYRRIDVGAGDVYVEVVTRLNDRGELEVEQHLVNDAQAPVSFRCHLFAPNRRRQKTQIIGLGPGRDVNTYRLPDGDQLIGKTLWLRAEQIDGPRVLNYRFVAEG